MRSTDSKISVHVPVATKRIPELDGLRGVAIIMVVAFHYVYNQLTEPSGTLERAVSTLTSFGWVGVDLFFVLSGFLIGGILMRTKSSANFFSTFYFRRLVRIVPNYYLLILVFFLMSSMPYFSQDYFLTQNNVIPGWAYLTVLQNFFMARLENFGNTALSVTWSISVEEQFYLIFPLAVYFLPRRRIPLFLLAAIAAAPVFRYYSRGWISAYVLLPCRMDAIAFGALIAWLNESGKLAGFLERNARLLWMLLLADLLVCGFLFFTYGDLGVVRNTLFSLFFAICLLFALGYKESVYAGLLRNKVLGFIGTISYSLYLFHFAILGLFKYLAGKWNGTALRGMSQVTISLAALCLSVFIAWLIYRKFETPFVALGKRLKY